MSFSRKFLTDNGVPEDKIDVILAERNRTLSDYIPKSDVQTQIDAAVEAAQHEPGDVKTAPEYQQLLAENQKIKALGSDDFKSVKTPYLDMVWDKLDHADKHKPYAEQLTGLEETMPDIFTPKETPPTKPQFGAQIQGQMPTGDSGKSFMDTWGFVPKK